ncbi:MAG TPA: lipopolysaccharide biosynthesis protein [Candidatus Thermoplasmatota archaeon]|nr:lipopolysaccharide biosynthesis protein [Candidatus Thermoplasmatota archaeon]
MEAPEPDASPVRRGLKDALLFAPGRILPAATALLLVVLAGRYLTLADLGAFGLYVTTLGLASVVLSGWLDQATLRYLPGHAERGETAQFLQNNHHALRRTTAATAALALLGILGAWLWVPSQLGEACVFGALLLGTVWYNNSQFLLVGQRKAIHYSLAEVLRTGVCVGGVLVVAALGHSSVLAFLATLTAGTVAGLLHSATRAGAWSPTASDLQGARAYLRNAWAYGFPLLGWILGAQALAFADRYLVQHFLGTEAVGIYYANYQFLPAIPFLLAMPLLYSAHTTIMAAADKATPAELESLVQRFGRLYVLVTLPLCLAVSLAATPVTRFLLGPEVAKGAYIVPWVIAGNFLWNLAMYGHKRFEVEGRTRLMLKFVLLCVVANVVLNLLLIPLLGLLGAAIATLASYALYPALVYVKRGGAFRWRL